MIVVLCHETKNYFFNLILMAVSSWVSHYLFRSLHSSIGPSPNTLFLYALHGRWVSSLRSNIQFTLTAEIAMFESNIVVYKFAQDLHFFVTGGEDENELILASVLQGFFDAVGILLRSWYYLYINFGSLCTGLILVFSIDIYFCFLYSRGNVEKKEALENLDLILLCLDEIIDGGYISYALSLLPILCISIVWLVFPFPSIDNWSLYLDCATLFTHPL